MSQRSRRTSVESHYIVAPPQAQQAYIVLSTGNSEVWTIRMMHEDAQITITIVPLWAKSGLRSTLRTSNLQNFPAGGAYPHTPQHVRAYAWIQTVRPPTRKCLPPPFCTVMQAVKWATLRQPSARTALAHSPAKLLIYFTSTRPHHSNFASYAYVVCRLLLKM